MRVEVAFALPDNQRILSVEVPDQTSAYDAVIASGIVKIYPQIDPDNDPMGVFGKAIPNPKTHMLRDGHRVEIYRPLIADPKASRAKRAQKAKKKASSES